MPKKSSTAAIAPTPEREHIFPASRLTPLAIKWKELSEAGRHKEAMLLLDEIIRGSTAMFERLAQYENLNSSVDLDILVSAAHEKMVRWLQAWNPKAGRLFTWLSKSYHADTYVLLADGSCKKISEIVDGRLEVDVLSWNRSENKFEAKPVINWFKSPVQDVSVWRRLCVSFPESYKTSNRREGTDRKIILTNDHEVYTDRGIVRVDEIKPTDRLYISSPSITPDGMSALIGMYLGDGTITKKDYFVVSHGTGQKEYTEHIAAKFGNRSVWHGRVTLKWKQVATGNIITKDYPVWKTRLLHKRIWKSCPLSRVKNISEWLLDNINPIVLAYWYMDDGYLEHVKKYNRYFPYFCSESFTYEDCARIAERLLVEWGIKAWLKKESVREGVVYARINICDASVDRFFKLVAPYLIPCFSYKMPVQYRAIAKKDITCIRYEAIPCTEHKVIKLATGHVLNKEKLSYKYDITVKDNHNIIAMTHGKTQNGVASGICACQCSKNAFLSEVGKVNQMRRRCYTTSDNLERFYGVEDHEVNRHDLAKEYKRRIQDIHCRWGDPQELGALRYLIDCIVDDSHDKQAAIRSAAYCWGISLPMAKFFYNWAVVGLRHQFYEKAYVPFTEYDLMLAAESYTLWPEIINAIGYEPAKKLVVLMGGSRVHIPSINAIAKLKEADQIRREIDRSNLDPATIAEIARKRKKTVRSAAEIYREMLAIQHPNRSGEFSIYGND